MLSWAKRYKLVGWIYYYLHVYNYIWKKNWKNILKGFQKKGKYNKKSNLWRKKL